MKLKQIDPIHSPQHFFMPRVDGMYTIYDLVAEDTSEINDCLRSLKKKVYGGEAEFKMYADHIEIEYNGLTVAKADLVAEYYTTSWQSVNFDFSSANITKIGDGTFRFVMIQGDNTFGLEWSFAYGIQTKQTFYLDIPGRNVRIKWRTEVLENALATNRDDNKGLKYSVDDYEGEVIHVSPEHIDEGWAYHIWTFEPDGYTCDIADSRTVLQRYNEQAGLAVDPYLEIDEQTTYIDVTCDGYTARIYSGGSEVFIGRVYDPDAVGTTAWFTFGSKCVVGGITYALSEDTGITVTVIENTPTRCIIQAIGDFEDSSQGSLANESGSSLFLVFYPDRFTQKIQFVNSGTITLSDSVINGFCFMEAVVANIASEDAIYENVGSESAVTSDAEYNSANYIGITSTELNIIGINLEETNVGTSSFGQYVDDPEGLRFRWNNGTLTSETHTISVMWVIDSANREGSTKLYSSTERLEQGVQYTNPSELTFNSGSAVTTGTGHTSIGTDGFASDGAYHIAGDSGTEDEMSIDLGQIEHKANIVLHDFPYTSGGGIVDETYAHTTFHDTLTTSAITARSPDGTGAGTIIYEGSGVNPTVTSDGMEWVGNTNELGLALIGSNIFVGNFTSFCEGSLLMSFTPNFSDYADISYAYLFGQTGAEVGTFNCSIAAATYGLIWSVAGRATFGDPYPFVADKKYFLLFKWRVKQIGADQQIDKWVYIDDILYFSASELRTGQSVAIPTTMYIGQKDESDNEGAQGTIKDFWIFDNTFGQALPYGAYFTGNTAAQLSAGMYHKDITFYDTFTTSASTARNPDKIGENNIEWIGTGSDPTVSASGMNWSNITDNGVRLAVADYLIGDFDTISQGSVLLKYTPDFIGVPTTNAYFLSGNSGFNNTLNCFISTINGGIHSYVCNLSESPGEAISWEDREYVINFSWKVVADGATQQIWRRIIVDGIVHKEDYTEQTSAYVLGTYIFLGQKDEDDNESCIGTIKDYYITSDPNTPQIPTANGVPLDVPIMRND